jgi:signal transduction histidine kinase
MTKETSPHFLSKVNHDLRQPLQALSMFLEILSTQEHAPQTRKIIDKIETCFHSLEGMLSIYFDIAKLDSGLTFPNKTSFSLHPILEHIKNDYTLKIKRVGLSLKIILCISITFSIICRLILALPQMLF